MTLSYSNPLPTQSEYMSPLGAVRPRETSDGTSEAKTPDLDGESVLSELLWVSGGHSATGLRMEPTYRKRLEGWIEPSGLRTPGSSRACKPDTLVELESLPFGFSWFGSVFFHLKLSLDGDIALCLKAPRGSVPSPTSRKEAAADYTPRGVWMRGQGRLHKDRPGKLDLAGRGGKIGEAIRKLFAPLDGEMKKYTSP